MKPEFSEFYDTLTEKSSTSLCGVSLKENTITLESSQVDFIILQIAYAQYKVRSES